MIYTTPKHKQSRGIVSILPGSVGLGTGWWADAQRTSGSLLVGI